jgi:hypothetical protein
MPNSQTAGQSGEAQKLSGNPDTTPENANEPTPPVNQDGIVVPVEQPQQQRGEVIDPPR